MATTPLWGFNPLTTGSFPILSSIGLRPEPIPPPKSFCSQALKDFIERRTQELINQKPLQIGQVSGDVSSRHFPDSSPFTSLGVSTMNNTYNPLNQMNQFSATGSFDRLTHGQNDQQDGFKQAQMQAGCLNGGNRFQPAPMVPGASGYPYGLGGQQFNGPAVDAWGRASYEIDIPTYASLQQQLQLCETSYHQVCAVEAQLCQQLKRASVYRNELVAKMEALKKDPMLRVTEMLSQTLQQVQQGNLTEEALKLIKFLEAEGFVDKTQAPQQDPEASDSNDKPTAA